MSIGIVGLGNMGGRIAKRLLQTGHAVGVYDPDQHAVDALVALGAKPYGSLRKLALERKLLFTVLPNAAVVQQVVLSDEGLLSGMQRGSILIDMTTSVTSVTQDIAAVLAEHGIRMLDAPVSGGVKKAELGTLTIMVGGADDVVAEVRPVLEQIGEQVIHLGEIGAGHTVKALNNLITATTLAITSEAMALGVKMGVDAQKILDAINVGSGRSASSETKFPQQILSGKFELGFSLALMCKDVGIAIDMANKERMPMWISSAVYETWKYGVAKGYGDQDHTAIARPIEELAGVKIRSEV